MAAQKFDQGYSFRSSDFRSQPDRWQQGRQGASPDGEDDGRRSCARAQWCGGYTLEPNPDGSFRRAPARTYQAFCPKDRRIIESDLRDMPDQFDCLADELGRPGSGAGQTIRIPFGPRLPIRVDVEALMSAIVESLSSWHERVAETSRLFYPPTADSRAQRDAFAVRRAVGVLAERVDVLLALEPLPVTRAIALRLVADLPDDADGVVHSAFAELCDPLGGAEAGQEILSLRYLCRAVLGETRDKPEELLGVPCRQEECDRRALVRAELPSDPDAPVWWSECGNCGDKMDEDEYRDWTRRYAKWAVAARRVPATLESAAGSA
jgi:hypothetical protein